MKKLKGLLAFCLVIMMLTAMLPLGVFAAEGETAPYRILHLDCGRKYFSKDWIISLIHEMAGDGYTHLELAFGNDGLRFLLNDMAVDAGGKTYTNEQVKNALQQANIEYNNKNSYSSEKNELTQAEMEAIISAAKKSGIKIIPLLNNPGHMHSILRAMEILGLDARYQGSASTVDIDNAAGLEFTKNLIYKYVDYFASKGSELFNIGADEYANDIGGSMGFARLVNNGQYGKFINYINDLNRYIKGKGMKAMAFNDGIYYNRTAGQGTIDNDILVAYWSSGWGGYDLAPASYLENKGFSMVNTNGEFYYILGKSDPFDNDTFSKASQFSPEKFAGESENINNPAGSMFCIWCDFPGAETEQEVARKARLPMRAMADAMERHYDANMDQSAVPGGFNTDGSLNTDKPIDPIVPEEPDIKTVTDTNTNISVTGPGIESVTAEAVGSLTIEGASKVAAWDIKPKTAKGDYHGTLTVKVPVPDDYDTSRICAFVQNGDGSISKIIGNYANGSYTFITPHCSVMGVLETNAESVVLGYGETAMREQNGLNEAISQDSITIDDPSIVGALISSTANTISGNRRGEKVPNNNQVIESGKKYIIAQHNGQNMLVINGNTYGNAQNIPESGAPVEDTYFWTFTKIGNSNTYTISTVINGQTRYLDKEKNERNFLKWTEHKELILNKNEARWTAENGSLYQTEETGSLLFGGGSKNYCIKYDGSNWTTGNSGESIDLYRIDEVPASTTYDHKITFEGKKPGSTDVHVGNITYNVTVEYKKENIEMSVTDSKTVANGTPADEITEPQYTKTGIVNAVVDGQNVTFKALSEGTTEVTVGYVKYNVTVSYNKKTVNIYIGNSAEDTQSHNIENFTPVTNELVDVAVNGDKVTFTGKAAGTTDLVIGNTKYKVNVTEENLAEVTPLTIELWITNTRPKANVGGTDVNSVQVKADFNNVHSLDGEPVENLVPANAYREGRKLDFLKVSINDITKENTSKSGTELQTEDNGDDETLNGIKITKIRYYNKKWQGYSADGWVDIDRSSATHGSYHGEKNQIVAYYFEIIDVKNAEGESEIYVNAADWGIKGDGKESLSYGLGAPCSVSIQLVYEDGTSDPVQPTAENLRDYTIVYSYWTEGRGLGTLRIAGMNENLIYRVTATTGKITDQESTDGGKGILLKAFDWHNDEETVWEEEPARFVYVSNPASKPSFDSPKDKIAWKKGSGNDNDAILIKVYIKTPEKEENLKVHYVDYNSNKEFYGYNISVKEGTLFNAGFGISNGVLQNNTVKNHQGVTMTVSDDLQSMPEVSKVYRYSHNELVETKRSTDGKEVFLYYTFDPIHEFILDFGLPIKFTPSDFGITADQNVTNIVAYRASYGRAEVQGNDLIYTPTRVLDSAEIMFVDVTTKNGAEEVTLSHEVVIYPASTVYYEESFMSMDGFTGSAATGTRYQQVHKLGESGNLFGYDGAYGSDMGISGGTEAVSTQGGRAEFEFTGTGIEIYANCDASSGMLGVMLKDMTTGYIIKFYTVDTRTSVGLSAVTGDGSSPDTACSLPVFVDRNLPFGNYKVTLMHIARGANDAGGNVRVDGFRVFNTLNDYAYGKYPVNERNPQFVEIRDAVISGLNLNDINSQYGSTDNMLDQIFGGNTGFSGALILSNNGSIDIKDLLDNGPKNEIFLYPNQALTFNIGTQRAQIGLKAVGSPVTYTITGVNGDQNIGSSVDMFYHDGLTGEITVTNKSGGVLSVTLLKMFNGVQPQMMKVSKAQVRSAMKSVGYAEESKVKGDLNGDGKIDGTDVVLAAQADAGRIELTAEQKALYDVNGDGVFDGADVIYLAQIDAGIIKK